jgi:transposase
MRRILIYVISLEPAMANPGPPRQDPKAAALARDGVLNPHPEGVRDPLFNDNPFFDPKDLVQVRYEMVRRHQNDGIAISDVAETFGVSRPTFYKAQGALAGQGLAGLVPRQRGPKGGHKISAEVLTFVEEVKAATPDLTLPQVIGMIAGRFGRDVHRRSLERALARKKNSPPLPRRSWGRGHQRLRAAARRSAWRRTDPEIWIGHDAA